MYLGKVLNPLRIILESFSNIFLFTGKTFRIQCCGNKSMQRIGAKDQKCLLHISKWGVTLALERSRAVLAQWPLTTIRNYECMDRCEFSFEAGRRSPMGPGKYTFYTQPGEDNRIFDTIDKFATERLQAQSRAGAGVVANSEEDMSRAYDQLRFSVLNIPAGMKHVTIQNSNYAYSIEQYKAICINKYKMFYNREPR